MMIPSASQTSQLQIRKTEWRSKAGRIIYKSHYHGSHMLHVWNIYLHWGDFWVNVGKYSIHGAFGDGYFDCHV